MMASAEVAPPSLDEVVEQERMLVLTSASPADLYALGRRAADAAIAEGLAIIVQIRLGDRLVFMASLPGGAALNDYWAERKARICHLFEKSSMRVRLELDAEGTDLLSRHGLPADRYAANGGVFPLRVAGVFAGSIAVSGLPQVEDHKFIVRVLGEHIAESAK
jgi:uncharacterized protein (UPF0303 family)